MASRGWSVWLLALLSLEASGLKHSCLGSHALDILYVLVDHVSPCPSIVADYIIWLVAHNHIILFAIRRVHVLSKSFLIKLIISWALAWEGRLQVCQGTEILLP